MSDKKLADAAEQIAAAEAEKAAATQQPEKPKRTIHWDDELMTTRQLMEFLSLSRTKIWELVNKEQLPAFKIGGDYRYRRTEVIEWLEKYRVKRG
ncbi:MAG: helix-turn-helix domain-containing protein [Rhodopirellula sp.]|nr:helix-turn-helix domain-containing protein [Rhodopirellula sp.]